MTKHVYDTHGNETEAIQNFVSGQSATNERNVSTTYVYGSSTAGQAGLITAITDPVGNTTSYTYDSLGRQLTEVLPGDSSIPALTRTTTYDEIGNILTYTDSWTGVTRTTTYAYDKANREASVTDPMGVESTASFDAAGNSVSVTASGVTTVREFDGLSRVVEESVQSDSTAHAYDGQGRDLETVDPVGVTMISAYDLGGRLISETVDSSEGDLVTTFSHDPLGRQTSTTGADGVTITTTYDRSGRTTATTAAGATTTYGHDRNGNLTSTSSPDSTVTTIQYDALNRAVVAIANDVATPNDPTDDVTTIAYYDALGRTIAIRDASGVTARSIHNPRGLVAQSIANCTDSGTTPSSNPPACTGQGTHNPTTNVVTTSTYDGSGAATTVVVAHGAGAPEATIEYAYDAAGRQQAVKDPRGTVTRTLYDNAGRITSSIINCSEDASSPSPPSGSWWTCDGSTLNDGTWNVTTSRTYDSHGNVSSETAPNGRVTTYVHDDADRLVQRVDNDVSGTLTAADQDLSTFYAYDDASRQIALRAPTVDRATFAVTRFIYNEDGQLVQEIGNCTESGTTAPGDPAWKTCSGAGSHDADTNLVTEYGYDTRGRRVSVTVADPSATTGTSTATVTTRYAYDQEGRLCGVLENATSALASPDPCAASISGTATQNVWTGYTYDGLGNLATMVDGRGKTTTHAYDEAGRMTSLTDPIDNMTALVYDALGRRTSQTERGAQPQPTLVSWTYDAAGRMVSRTAGGATTNYGYDDNGNRTSTSDASGTITVTYDRLNRPLSVASSTDLGAGTTYIYSLTSPSWSDPSGSYSASLDKFERQVALIDPVHGSSQFTFTYRADGQRSTIAAPNGNTTTFGYDDARSPTTKVTTSSSGTPASYTWTRNRAGQILTEASTITGDSTNGTTAYTYDPLARLTSFARGGSTTTYGWQAVPNRSSVQLNSAPVVTTTFDDANRPTSDSGGGSYNSDDEGRLIARPGQTLEWDDLGRLTAVTNAATQAVIASYSYDALDRLLVVERPGVDELRFRYVGVTTQVAQVVDNGTGTSIFRVANDWFAERLFEWTASAERFHGTNGHRDVTWTGDASGSVSATMRYDPWGTLANSTGSYLPEFRFQSSWFDASVDLSWVVSRWYAPALGRFVSEDSLLGDRDQPGSRHRYAYGEGEPIRRVDLAGYKPIDDTPPAPNASIGYWVEIQPGESVSILARRYLGTPSRWPTIYNRNRWVYEADPARIPVKKCVYIEPKIAPRPPNTPACRTLHSVMTGTVSDWRNPNTNDVLPVSSDVPGTIGDYPGALKRFGINWLQLTRPSIKTITNRHINRMEDPGAWETIQYGARTAIPDRVAELILNGGFGPLSNLLPADLLGKICMGGNIVFRDHGTNWIKGNNCVPSNFGGSALTLGHWVFGANSAFTTIGCAKAPPCPPTWLQSHEYIHTLQYQGNLLDFVDYMSDSRSDVAMGMEAMAYLWGAWTRAYSRWESEPWEIWLPR